MDKKFITMITDGKAHIYKVLSIINGNQPGRLILTAEVLKGRETKEWENEHDIDTSGMTATRKVEEGSDQGHCHRVD